MINKLLSCLTVLYLSIIVVKAQGVSLLDQTSFELEGTVSEAKISVPLKLDSNLTLEKVTIGSKNPFIVRLGNKNTKEFIDAITVSLNKQQPALDVTANLSILKTQGNYEVTVLYSVPTKKDQPLKFTLVRPAAQIDTVSTIYINIVGDEVTREDPFVLYAETNQVDINGLTLSNPYFTGVNRGDLVRFPASAYMLKARSMFKAEYKLDDALLAKLPLAKTAGKLRVMSPEMTAPVSVNFVIWKKRHWVWIVGTVFIGLLVGFGVRQLLNDKKEREQSRIKGLELLQQIMTEMRMIGDKPFREDVNKLLNELLPFLNSRGGLSYFTGVSDKILTDKIESTAKKYNEQITQFQTLLKTQQDAFNDLIGNFENRVLNDYIKNLLQPALSPFRASQKLLSEKNPTAAKVEIENTVVEINKILNKFYSYYLSVEQLMESDDFYPKELPDSTKAILKGNVANLKTQLSLINTKTFIPKEVTQSVVEADRAFELTDKIINLLVVKITNIYGYPDKYKSTDEAKKFDSVLAEWKAWLQTIRENPNRLTIIDEYPAPGLIARLNTAWDAIIAILGYNPGEQDAPMAIEQEEKITLANRPAFVVSDFDSDSVLAGIIADTQRAQKNWMFYNIIQFIVLLLLLGLAFYKVYAPTFIGTLDELITIFLIAFSVDITAENVVQIRDRSR